MFIVNDCGPFIQTCSCDQHRAPVWQINVFSKNKLYADKIKLHNIPEFSGI